MTGFVAMRPISFETFSYAPWSITSILTQNIKKPTIAETYFIVSQKPSLNYNAIHNSSD